MILMTFQSGYIESNQINGIERLTKFNNGQNTFNFVISYM